MPHLETSRRNIADVRRVETTLADIASRRGWRGAGLSRPKHAQPDCAIEPLPRSALAIAQHAKQLSVTSP